MNWYKATGPGGNAMFGTGTWNLPTDDGPGEWMPRLEGQIIPCVYGYHVTDAAHVIEWFGPEMYLAEVDPAGVLNYVIPGDKWVTPTARLVKKLAWDAETALQFIEDCDQHVGGLSGSYLVKAQQDVTGSVDPQWGAVATFLGDCRTAFGLTFEDNTWSLQQAHMREERLWQNQRLLMYLHGGIA